MTATHYFEDIEPGTTAHTDWMTIDENHMIEFARQWDPMPIHVDRVAAAASPFGGITASSVYTWGIKQLLIKQLLTEESAICMLGFTEGSLPAALRGERRVRLEAAWLDKRRSGSRRDCGIVRFRIRLLTDQEEVVLDYIETLLLKMRAATTD